MNNNGPLQIESEWQKQNNTNSELNDSTNQLVRKAQKKKTKSNFTQSELLIIEKTNEGLEKNKNK